MKLFCCSLTSLIACLAFSQGYDPSNYKDLSWVSVGPPRGGRSIACTGVRSRPNEFYFGATGGGLWKSTDAGATWNCVTDGFLGSSSVGAVAVSDSNPDVVYIGTGEREIRGDISEGDGLYKSTDAGKTWKRAGLENTRTISRIVVDPKDPNDVYVAALGHTYAPGPDRGVYKSTDGGQTWSKILFVSDRAGAVDLQMDPKDPYTLYAATWEAWRKPYFLNSGGPGSKLFKTTDGGRKWTELTRNPGLPAGIIGKIGISVSPVDNRVVWAIVEAKDGGIYRSADAGATWSKVSDDHNFTQRAWYFSHVYADTKDLNKLYCLNVGSSWSANGGKSWTRWRTTHSDNHDLWISPDDPKRMIEANDGGASVTVDGGTNWTRESYPTGEIYHVVADNHIPYRIYGAQQDNSALRVSPSEPNRPDRPNWGGSAGGESGYMAVSATNPDLVYGGNYSGELEELDYGSNQSRNINPWPDNPMGHAAADLTHRIQWTFPIVFSPTDPHVLYTASQYLLKTTDAGHSWRKISPDLTRNDKSKQASSGGPITQDNTSVEYYDTIFTVAESPVRRSVIWAGSDDGLIHVTRDAGGSWSDVTPQGMPHWGRVSMIEASPHDAATAYAAVNDYQDDDTAPYIYRTHDYGQTWKKIVTGIPMGSFARVCREDLRRPGLLFAGTETGAFVSFDDGDHWQSLQQNLPLCPVHDLCLKDDDLIAATHGRAFWIMHNVSRLEELSVDKPAHPVLYKPIDRLRLDGQARVSADYYLPTNAKSVVIRFLDREGQQMGQVEGEKSAGYHAVNTTLAHAPFGTFPGMIMWSGFPMRVPAPPGLYTVTIDVDNYKDSKVFHLRKDPRAKGSEKDLQDQYSFSVEVSNRVNDANQAVLRIRDEMDQLDAAAKKDPTVGLEVETLKGKLLGIEGEIYQYRSHAGEDPLNFPVMLNDKLAGVLSTVQSGQFAPTQQAREVYRELSKKLQVQLDLLRAVEESDVVRMNRTLKGKGIAPVVPKNPPFSARRSRSFDEGGDEDEDRPGRRPRESEEGD
ncbi:MAG TPA: hypothetical protein VG944_00390 [Fimbriimonas sp.]|nr:hypothetical protein [Fimbriimonas sp.]